jgi:hypothetical protein
MPKVLVFLGVLIGGAALLAGRAAADRPSTEVENIVGDQALCGDVLLTVTSGTIVTRVHEHQKRNGLVQEVFNGPISGVTLIDEEGNTYRAVGASGGQFTFDPSVAEENGFGHFKLNVNFVGQQGLLGQVRERFQITRSGRVVERNTGSCQLLEAEE